jgi:hypothetical protein
MPTGPTFVNITQGKKACINAPDNFAKGHASKPLSKINPIDATVNDNAEIGSKVFADSEMKMSDGSAMSTTNLLALARSGFTRRANIKPTQAIAKMGSVMAAIFKNMAQSY